MQADLLTPPAPRRYNNDEPPWRRTWLLMPQRPDSPGPVGPAADLLPANADTGVVVRDVSAAGIGLLLPHRLAPGTLLGIELPDAPAPPAIVLATVAHVTAGTVGCRFALDLDEEDLKRFRPGAGRSRFFDRRTQKRRPCEACVACWPVHDPGVRRLSAAPVRVDAAVGVLLATQPLPLGMVLEWEMPGALTILASVARVTRQAERWAVACPFIRELTRRELRAVRAILRHG
jgi:hypothetical protein